MSSNPSPASERDPLQALLEDTEDELRSRLHAACEAEAKGVSTETTEQIRRLEDDLLAAAVAAKQTIDVCSHMNRERATHAEQRERAVKSVAATRDTRPDTSRTGKPAPKVDDSGERTVMGVREFSDDRGTPWRAWSVVPGLNRASGGGFLGDFQSGWICFESLGSPARRRLPYPRSKWSSLSDEDLKRLLDQAIDAPIRGEKDAAPAK